MKNPRSRISSTKTERAGDILEKTLGLKRLSGKLARYQAFPEWPNIVGEEIANISLPEKITRGRVLVVRVVDAAWAQELALKKQELLNLLFAAKTGTLIQDITFITGDPGSIRRGRNKGQE